MTWKEFDRPFSHGFIGALAASCVLIFGFGFHQQTKSAIKPSIIKTTPPKDAIPAADSFVADFDSTAALGTSLDKRDLHIFESMIEESKRSPVEEYQLALDLLQGRNVRLYRQQQGVGPGFNYNADCHCFMPPPSQPVAAPAAKPATDKPETQPAKK